MDLIVNHNKVPIYFTQNKVKLLLDYITNLQQEINKLTAESTEWESKCYDLQQENERLEENNSNMQEEMARTWEKCDDYKSRCEKAIEYINGTTFFGLRSGKTFMSNYLNNLLNILKGGK